MAAARSSESIGWSQVLLLLVFVVNSTIQQAPQILYTKLGWVWLLNNGWLI
jgi:hypothetical protein